MRYAPGMPFDQSVLDLLDRTQEVEIETRTPGGATNRTILWIVADGGDVFVRSYRGPSARWYSEALADRLVVIHTGDRRLDARVVPAGDPKSIARTSAALGRTYAGDPATPAMVRSDVLDTTLRLDPV